MSVEITFQPADLSGLHAEGAYLIDAARRMGLRLPADCHERGECTSCVVSIVAGQSLLSPPTNAEKKMLAEERLSKGQRLACQTRMESSGEVVVRLIPASNETSQNSKDSKKPGGEKFIVEMGQEVMTMMKTFDAFIEKSLSVGENMLDRFAERVKSTRERELETKRPPEHRHRRES